MHRLELLFQHGHGKHARARADIAGAGRDSVGRRHAGARITLRRAEQHARFDFTVGIEQLRALVSQLARVSARAEYLGQQAAQRPVIAHTLPALLKERQHLFVIIVLFAVNGEYARRVTHAQHKFARQLPMDVARQCRQIRRILDVRFAVQHRLIQVRDAPSLRNVEAKKPGQLLRGARGSGIAPGAEGRQQLALFVKGKIAVHHRGNAHRAQLGQLCAILLFHIMLEVADRGLHARPDLVQAVGPIAALIAVFPAVAAGGNG